MMPQQPIRVAIIDLYDHIPNQGMRCIREILAEMAGRLAPGGLVSRIFDSRGAGDLPDLSFDIYISTGGPGSPFDGAGLPWESRYFSWLEALWSHNLRGVPPKKFAFAICHSFQLFCRFFGVAQITERRSTSFGIMPVYQTSDGLSDPLYSGLPNPFFAADFRDWQAIQPDHRALVDLGAKILSLEKIRPQVAYERAVMAIRFSPEVAGVQFHPEADAASLLYHFRKPERKRQIIEKHGEEKYQRILYRLTHPDYLAATRETILPNFLARAINELRHFQPAPIN